MRTIALSRRLTIACATAIFAWHPSGAHDAGPNPPVTFTDPPLFWMPDSGSGWVDFKPTDDGHILIPILLNGSSSLALVDTGFDQLVVSKAYADSHHLPLTPWAKAISLGGPTRYYTTPSVAIDVGALRTTKPGGVTVVGLQELATATSQHFDAVIGLPMLGPFEWQIDQDHHRFRLLKSGSIPIPSGIPIRTGPHNSRLVVDVRINGKPIAPAMIDTGSDSSISLPHAVAKDVGFTPKTDMGSMGAGGSFVEEIGVLKSFAIGTRNVTGAYATVDDWTDKEIGARIGMGTLGSYNMTVDLTAGKMMLSTRAIPPGPIPKSTSGVQGPFHDGRLTITHVMRNSPAADAGLKAGDEICSVDGDPMSQALVDRHWGRAAAGTHYQLGLCDGVSRGITLRAFY